MAERHFEERRSTAMEGKGVESAETAAYAAAKNSSDGAGSDSGGSQKSNRPASSEKSETGNRPFNVCVFSVSTYWYAILMREISCCKRPVIAIGARRFRLRSPCFHALCAAPR